VCGTQAWLQPRQTRPGSRAPAPAGPEVAAHKTCLQDARLGEARRRAEATCSISRNRSLSSPASMKPLLSLSCPTAPPVMGSQHPPPAPPNHALLAAPRTLGLGHLPHAADPWT